MSTKRPRHYDEDYRAYAAVRDGVAAAHEMDAELSEAFGRAPAGFSTMVNWFDAWSSSHTFTMAQPSEQPPDTLFVSIDEYAEIRSEWVLVSRGTPCAVETRALLGRACACMDQTTQNAAVALIASADPLPARAAYVMIDRTIEYLSILRKQIATGWTYSERKEKLRFLLEQPYETRWYNFRRWTEGATDADILPADTNEGK